VPAAFTLADTSAVSGTLSNLQQTDATHYTATFTGAANTDISTASVSVTTGSWQEGNGNAGAGGSTAAFTVDTVTPTVALSIDSTFINQAHTTGTVTFTFSEAPTAFTLADSSAVGGTLSNLAGAGNTYTATFTGAAKSHISNASVSVTAGSWQESNSNPGDGGSSALFEVDTLSMPQPATIAVSSDPTAVRGQVISLSTLLAISDRFGLGFQSLELWDSQGTMFGGQFVVNGVPQTRGHEIDVSPTDVANTVFDVGTLGGSASARQQPGNGLATVHGDSAHRAGANAVVEQRPHGDAWPADCAVQSGFDRRLGWCRLSETGAMGLERHHHRRAVCGQWCAADGRA
jgi:Bacterial Ig-like domain